MTDAIELIYDEVIADAKLKHGTKLEHLGALFFKHLNSDAEVVHDVRLRGEGRKTVHQIDITIRGPGGDLHLIIECRHLLASSKRNLIRLPAVRDFASVVRDLQPERAMMLTTVGFTKPAATYAREQGIELAILRAFEEDDWRGRVQRVKLHAHLLLPSPLTITDWLVVNEADRVHVESGSPNTRPQSVHTREKFFRDASGDARESFFEVLDPIIHALPLTEGRNVGQYTFDTPKWLMLGDALVAVRGFAWRMDLTPVEQEIVVEVDEKDVPRLLLQYLDRGESEVITEMQLQALAIGSGGVVKQSGRA